MIVNTAYPYMKSAVPVNPVVFNGNTVNYPYSTDGNVSLESGGFRFGGYEASVKFENVDLSKYTKLNLTAQNLYSYNQNVLIQITAPDGSVSNNLIYTIYAGSTSNFDQEIPSAFRVKNCSLKMYMGSVARPSLLAMNLTCK